MPPKATAFTEYLSSWRMEFTPAKKHNANLSRGLRFICSGRIVVLLYLKAGAPLQHSHTLLYPACNVWIFTHQVWVLEEDARETSAQGIFSATLSLSSCLWMATSSPDRQGCACCISTWSWFGCNIPRRSYLVISNDTPITLRSWLILPGSENLRCLGRYGFAFPPRASIRITT